MAAKFPAGKRIPAADPVADGIPDPHASQQSQPERGAAENGIIIILCTAPDKATAQALAGKLLGEKLAGCVTLLPGATSLYFWEGKLEQEDEVQMLIKSHVRHQQELIACIKTHHPYQTPELLVLPVQGGDPDYLSWLNASLH